MAIGPIGSTGSVSNQTVGGVGGDSSTKVQDLLAMLQSGTGANSSGGAGAGGCSCGCKGGGCSCCAGKASNGAKSIGG